MNTYIYYTKENNNGKICIYTGNFGNYDIPVKHVKQTVSCDFIYFYDIELPGSYKLSIPKLSPVLTSAWIRTYPPSVLHHYDIIIYIDANKQIDNPNFIADIITPHLNEKWDMMISKHPWRICAYTEIEASRKDRKYKNTNLNSQKENYVKDGFPPNYGLFWNGLLVYNTKSNIKEFQDLYWKEFSNYAINPEFHPQGQVSLPYCLWKNPIHLITLLNLYDNKRYIKSNLHLK